MIARPRLLAATGLAVLAAAALGGCKSKGELVVDEGVGVSAVRGTCPAVGIPDYTGDVTLFRDPASTDANAIDVTAAITNLRPNCAEGGTTEMV